jgi:hypothetical protein
LQQALAGGVSTLREEWKDSYSYGNHAFFPCNLPGLKKGQRSQRLAENLRIRLGFLPTGRPVRVTLWINFILLNYLNIFYFGEATKPVSPAFYDYLSSFA